MYKILHGLGPSPIRAVIKQNTNDDRLTRPVAKGDCIIPIESFPFWDLILGKKYVRWSIVRDRKRYDMNKSHDVHQFKRHICKSRQLQCVIKIIKNHLVLCEIAK